MEFVDTEDVVSAGIVTLVVFARQEGGHECVGDLLRLFVSRFLGEPDPRVGDRPVPETEVTQSFPADDIEDRRLALLSQQRHQFLSPPQHVGVVAAAQPAVRRNHQHGGPPRIPPLDQQRMVQCRLGREVGEHVGDLGGVGPRRRHPGLRLGDARRGDQLLGLGDLLDRPGRLDPPAEFAKCSCHYFFFGAGLRI